MVSCCLNQHSIFFSSLIDGCLKYKNKEKPKTGPRLSPHLNYDVKISPKPGPRGIKKSGPIGPGLKCRALHYIAFRNSQVHFSKCIHLISPIRRHTGHSPALTAKLLCRPLAGRIYRPLLEKAAPELQHGVSVQMC